MRLSQPRDLRRAVELVLTDQLSQVGPDGKLLALEELQVVLLGVDNLRRLLPLPATIDSETPKRLAY